MVRHAVAALGAFLAVIVIGSTAAAQVDVNVDYRNSAGGGGGGGGAKAGGAAKPGAAAGQEGGFANESIDSIRKVDLTDPDEDFYGLNLPQQALYSGVIPNVRDTLPHLRNSPLLWTANTRRNRARRNRLTWIGFQRQPQQTRVFIQTGRATTYSVSRSVDGVSLYITLDNTTNTFSNFRRNIDTRWYPRSISGVRARSVRGRKVRIEIDTRIAAEYNISSEGNYIYVDFKDSSLEQQIAPTGPQPKPEDDDGVLADPDPLGD